MILVSLELYYLVFITYLDKHFAFIYRCTHTCRVLWGLILRGRGWYAGVVAHFLQLLLRVHGGTSGNHRHVLDPREVVCRHPWVGHGMRRQRHTSFGHRVQATGREAKLKKT